MPANTGHHLALSAASYLQYQTPKLIKEGKGSAHTSILGRSVYANTKVSVASRRRRLGQTAIPRVYDSLIKAGSLVKTEPSLLVVPPYGSGRTLLILAGLASSRTRTRRRGRRRRSGLGRNTSGSVVGVTFRASASEATLGVLANASFLGAGLGGFSALIDVLAVVTVASVTFLASALVARSLVNTSGVGVALLPGETERVLGVGTLVNVGTAESVTDESVVANAFEAALGVDALGVSRASLRSVVGVSSTLVNVATEETVAFVTGVTLTGNTRVGGLTGGILGTNSKFRNRLGAVVNSLAEVTISDVAFLTGTAESGLLVLAVGMRRARLGGSSRFAALINIDTGDTVTFVSRLTGARDTRVGRSTDGMFVALSVVLVELQTVVGALRVETEGVALEAITGVAFETGTLDTREEGLALSVDRARTILRGDLTVIVGSTGLSVSRPTLVANALVASYSVLALGVGATLSGLFSALIDIGTGLTVTFKTRQTGTLDTREGRFTSGVRRARAIFRARALTVVSS